MTCVSRIREFNRYYARILGIFDKKFLGVDFSVTEVRILGEIGRNRELTAGVLADYLGIDKGYMSRTIQGLEKKDLIKRTRSEKDGREWHLGLTEQGETLNGILEQKADQRIEDQIRDLDEGDFQELLKSMDQIKRILSKAMPDAIQKGD